MELATLNLQPFDYAQPIQQDDFERVVERLLAHQRIVFATPVYWYAMSGRMKTLFDRLTDLSSDRDHGRRGRALRRRQIWVLAVGTGPALPEGFDIPFASTAGYLGMLWRSICYVPVGRDATEAEDAIRRLAEEILSHDPPPA